MAVKNNNKDKALLFIHSRTPIHVGSGTSVSYIDLPIQRERITQFPVINASSLKGAFRACFRRKGVDKKDISIIFGPGDDLEGEEASDTDQEFLTEASDHAGALSLTDAHILLYPVRSLSGVFAWITCPLILKRFMRSLRVLKPDNLFNVLRNNLSNSTKVPNSSTAHVGKGTALQVCNSGQIVLEEFTFQATKQNYVDTLAEFLKEKAFSPDDPFRDTLHEKLVVLADNVFRDFVLLATEVVTRIRIDPRTGTVGDGGGLWSEELIPAEAVFWSLAHARLPPRSRNNSSIKSSLDVVDIVKTHLENQTLHVGGDTTLGRGLVHIIMTNDI